MADVKGGKDVVRFQSIPQVGFSGYILTVSPQSYHYYTEVMLYTVKAPVGYIYTRRGIVLKRGTIRCYFS